MSRAAIAQAIGPRAAVRLARNCGGAALYVALEKPKYTEISDAERIEIGKLYSQGYYNREIATLVGRSVGTVGCVVFCEIMAGRVRRLPKPQSTDGRIVRARLRREGAIAAAAPQEGGL